MISAEDSASALLARIKSAEPTSAAKQWFEQYAFARLWRLTMAMANCPAEDKDRMVEIKCEMRSVLLQMNDMRINIADAEAASNRYRSVYQSDGKKR